MDPLNGSSSTLSSDPSGLSTVAQVALSIGLVTLSAVFAGLTIGIMRFNEQFLVILSEAGKEPERTYAAVILPVRRLGHRTLCTLVLGNMAANVMIAELCADVIPSEGGMVGSGIYGFILSTVVIMIFTEVVPMSVCSSARALKIAADLVLVVKLFLVLLFPIAWPLAWALDWLIPPEKDKDAALTDYSVKQLQSLVMIHQKENKLGWREAWLLDGALKMCDTTVSHSMLSFSNSVLLHENAIIDRSLVRALWKVGKRRFLIVRKVNTELGQSSEELGSTEEKNGNSFVKVPPVAELTSSIEQPDWSDEYPEELKDVFELKYNPMHRVEAVGILYLKDLLQHGPFLTDHDEQGERPLCVNEVCDHSVVHVDAKITLTAALDKLKLGHSLLVVTAKTKRVVGELAPETIEPFGREEVHHIGTLTIDEMLDVMAPTLMGQSHSQSAFPTSQPVIDLWHFEDPLRRNGDPRLAEKEAEVIASFLCSACEKFFHINTEKLANVLMEHSIVFYHPLAPSASERSEAFLFRCGELAPGMLLVLGGEVEVQVEAVGLRSTVHRFSTIAPDALDRPYPSPFTVRVDPAKKPTQLLWITKELYDSVNERTFTGEERTHAEVYYLLPP